MTPPRSQPVVVRLGAAEALPARVDRAEADCLTLVLSVPGRPRDAEPAVVEYVTPTGIHRIAGQLSSQSGDPSVVHLHRDAHEVVQRREWARVEAVVPVDVRFEDPSLQLAATVTLNLSGGGALIRDPVGVPLGTPVWLEVHLDSEPIRAQGTVVRKTSDGAKGVQIEAIADADRERIVRFVTERQRSHLRLRRRGA